MLIFQKVCVEKAEAERRAPAALGEGTTGAPGQLWGILAGATCSWLLLGRWKACAGAGLCSCRAGPSPAPAGSGMLAGTSPSCDFTCELPCLRLAHTVLSDPSSDTQIGGGRVRVAFASPQETGSSPSPRPCCWVRCSGFPTTSGTQTQ